MVRRPTHNGAGNMRFNDLKAALQPSLDDDLGKLYAEFVRKSGTGDLVRFIGYLRDEGIVAPTVLEKLVSDGVVDSGAVEALARQATPRPTPSRGRLHAPTLMPEVDDDEEDEAVAAPAAESTSEPAPAAETPVEPAADAAPEEAAPVQTEATDADATPEEAASDAPPPEASVSEETVDADATPPTAPERAAVEDDGEATASDDTASDDTADDGDDDDDDDEDAGSTGARPKRRDEARATGGRRRTGSRTGSRRRTSERTGTGARRRAGGAQGATGTGSGTGGHRKTSARDRLKRTMFSLRQKANQDVSDTTDILRRDYKFVGKVGEGAMGRVLKAKDNDLLRLVAYKEMSEEIASNAALASKFYAEAQITAQLDHPNIVPVYQLEQNTDGMLAYTMKLIKGKTVEDYIDEVKEAYQKYGKKKLPEEYSLEKRLEIFLRCCDALFYAHSRGVVHRDLKPENIMIGAYGEVYIMDWGIAKVVRTGDIITEDPIELVYEPEEEPDLIIGTPQYMSPEQANGDNADLDHRSDQYSMGLILYELISCKQAVTGKSAMKIVMRQQDAEKDPLQHAFGDRIPRELKAIMEKCTTKSKDARFKNIHTVADDIRHYLRDEPIAARPDTVPQAMGRWIRRHTALTAFIVLTLLSIAGIGVVVVGAGAAIYTTLESAKQARINGLRSSVFAQASKVDGALIAYKGLLGTVVATATEKLTLSAADENVTYYTSKDFDEEKVPGLVDSSKYGMKLSLEHPTFHIPEGAKDPELADRQARQLITIDSNLRTALLRSESEEAARFKQSRYERRIAKQGTPLTWAFIGLESGAYVHYPGKGDLDGYDPREQPWYTDVAKNAQRSPGPRWAPPFPDYHGQGYVMTVSQPIFDINDDLIGVAGVSLTFDYVIDELLQLPESIDGVREVMILNEHGEQIISTEDAGKKPEGGRSAKKKRTPTFEVESVVEAIESYQKGGVEYATVDDKASIVFYNRMEDLGWYLVVVGDPAEMMQSDI